jgi:hypothetical protein
MTKIKFLLLFISTIINSSLCAQQVLNDSTEATVLIFSAVKKQKGIYRTFEEFLYNKPSIPFVHALKVYEEAVQPHSTYWSFKIDYVSKEMPCTPDTKIWGLCDGSVICISRSATFGKRDIYDKVITMDSNYVYYQSAVGGSSGHLYMNSMTASGGGMVMGGGGSNPKLVDFIIDVKSGDSSVFSEELMRTLIASDAQLIAQFDALSKRQKKKQVGEFYLNYVRRRKLESMNHEN